ncbi:hypothetical protein RRG08_027039 [Elysia crispata]|uniref:Uncharacterized protein n=1 Tax=Elysia crispata TaxID=231223 RepID=A0AAE1DG59_9GAST|nr:hypothetical protein RRG08_027039 [Elysia crispata]
MQEKITQTDYPLITTSGQCRGKSPLAPEAIWIQDNVSNFGCGASVRGGESAWMERSSLEIHAVNTGAR